MRKALNKAINRDELNEAFFGNKGATMYHAHVYPTQLWFNQGWIDRYPEEYGFDPAASRSLLAEAGYSADNPLNTIITLSSRFAGSEDVALSIMSFWRDVGVDAEALTIDSTKQRNLRRNREFDNNTYVTNHQFQHLHCHERVPQRQWRPHRLRVPGNVLHLHQRASDHGRGAAAGPVPALGQSWSTTCTWTSRSSCSGRR